MDTNSLSARSLCMANLLGSDGRLVIPDMQRDFCWGADKTAVFIAGIMRLYAQRRPYALGLLYGYEQPHIHVIDGQQRLTVMYLLMGMLYRRTSQPWLKHLLISDGAADDCEPKLVYQARREAFYFLSDLVGHFFLERDGRLSMLEQSRWYYASYDADTTVQSMIGAIRAIDAALDAAAGIDFDDFALFATRQLTFVYCQLPDSQAAQRMFITINTTGQPLSPAQRLRAQTIADEPARAQEIACRWTEMEDFFWEAACGDRGESACGDRASIDDFVALWPEATFDKLYQRFGAYRRLAAAIDMRPSAYPTTPCVEFALRWPEASQDELRRIWRFFFNIARYQRPGKTEDELAVKLVLAMPSPDALSLLDVGRGHDRFVNDEERAKLSLILANLPRRAEAEAILARGEDHPMLNGRMARLIDWGKGILEAISAYVSAFYDIWGTDIDRQMALDPVRRSLLAIGHKGYPLVRRGDSVLSLCWNDYDWQRLMLLAPGAVRQLIDNPGKRRVDKNHPYFALITKPNLLANSRKRQLQRPCPAFIGIYDLNLRRTRWLVDQIELPQPAGWSQIRAYGALCLYADHLTLNAALDLYYQPGQPLRYRLELFSRPDSPKPAPDLTPLAHLLTDPAAPAHASGSTHAPTAGSIQTPAATHAHPTAYDRARRRFVAYYPTASAALAAARRLFSSLP